MTLSEAHQILHPDTSRECINKNHYGLKDVEESIRIACECIKRCIDMEDDGK